MTKRNKEAKVICFLLDSGWGQVYVPQSQHQRYSQMIAFGVMGEVRQDFAMTTFTLDSLPAPITNYFLEYLSLPNTLVGAIEGT